MSTRPPCVIGKRCERHDFIHGAEAEELREGLERLIAAEEEVEGEGALTGSLRRLLDRIDARDSVAYVEVRNRQRRADRARSPRKAGTP